MSKRALLVTLTTAVLAAGPAAVGGQETHAVDRGELERATAAADRADAARREAIRSVLEDERVEEVARAHGLEPVRVQAAVAALEGEPLERVAATSDRVEEALAGGDDAIVISTTTLIIALLVLIIILVA